MRPTRLVTTLPALAGLSPGTAADGASTRRFLAADGRAEALGQVLGTVQRVLAEGRGRVVLAVPDDQTAALWLAAVCRSLPRAISLGISFVTYTSRPENQEVLVSCTTPDVRLPNYGDFSVVDLTDGTPDAEVTRYGAVMALAWRHGRVDEAVRMAEGMSPAPTVTELEAFSVVLEAVMGLDTKLPVEEELLFAAVELAQQRLGRRFTVDAWQHIADQVQDAGGPRDLARWATLLNSLLDKGFPVPATLLGTYAVAVLTAPDGDDAQAPRWLPRLEPSALDDIAENVLLPRLTEERPPAALVRRLGVRPDLQAAVVRALDQRLRNDREVLRLAGTLSPEVAQLLSRSAGTGSAHVQLLLELVLARAGKAGRAAVLTKAAHGNVAGWQRLDTVLWPQVPAADEAVRALRALPDTVLSQTSLLSRIVERVLRDAELGELAPRDHVLVEELLAARAAELVPSSGPALRALALVEQLGRATPRRDASRQLADALEVAAAAPRAIGDRLVEAAASFVLRADEPRAHAGLLELALSTRSPRFMSIYQEQSCVELAKAAPKEVAVVIVSWESLSDRRLKRELVEKTLARALRRRRGKHLDKVGSALESTAKSLGRHSPRKPDDWRLWWQGWRATHERRGLFGLLRGRR